MRGGIGGRAVANVDEIATALSDQSDYEHVWLLGPRTGELVE